MLVLPRLPLPAFWNGPARLAEGSLPEVCTTSETSEPAQRLGSASWCPTILRYASPTPRGRLRAHEAGEADLLEDVLEPLESTRDELSDTGTG